VNSYAAVPAPFEQVVSSAADEVDVRVIEPGDDAPPERAYHAGAGSGQGSDIGLVADGSDRARRIRRAR
jgi:hypothetical protein